MTRPAILADLSAWSKLVFAGPDRRKFLNGLVTADVLKLPERRGTLACLLTPKGRLRADFELYDRGEDLLTLAVPKAGANLREDLGKKLMLSETTLAEADARLFYAGGRAPFGADGLRPWEARSLDWRGTRIDVLSRPRLQPDGFWVLVPAAKGDEAWAALIGEGFSPVESLEALRIESGVPVFGVDIDETTIPQEAGLDEALSFDKGCYLGQETISRVHHMGHVNRVLVRLSVEGAPEAGAEVVSGGRMTSRAGSFALATVRLADSKPGTTLVIRSGGKDHAATVLS